MKNESWFHKVFTNLTVTFPKGRCSCSCAEMGSPCGCGRAHFPWTGQLVSQLCSHCIESLMGSNDRAELKFQTQCLEVIMFVLGNVARRQRGSGFPIKFGSSEL